MGKKLNASMVWAGDSLSSGWMFANLLPLQRAKTPHVASLKFLPIQKAVRLLALVFLFFVFTLPTTVRAADLPLNQLTLPPGFTIELLARVPNARQMALGDGGVLYVGSPGSGQGLCGAARCGLSRRPGAGHRLGVGDAGRGGFSGGRSLCFGGQSHSAFRHWACAFTPARNSPRLIAARFLLPSMVRGIAARRPAIGSVSSGWLVTRWWLMSLSSAAG